MNAQDKTASRSVNSAAEAGTSATAGGCCATPQADQTVQVEVAAPANPCCGTSEQAATESACCGASAKAEALAAAAGCCS